MQQDIQGVDLGGGGAEMAACQVSDSETEREWKSISGLLHYILFIHHCLITVFMVIIHGVCVCAGSGAQFYRRIRVSM